MKKSASVLLSFFVLLSSLGFLPFLNFRAGNDVCGASGDVSKVFAVQYELYRNAKKAVMNISDSIIKDMSASVSRVKTGGLFFDAHEFFVRSSDINLPVFIKMFFSACAGKILYENAVSSVSLFVFVFIFVFLTRYLGLLRTFWNRFVPLLCEEKEAYGI